MNTRQGEGLGGEYKQRGKKKWALALGSSSLGPGVSRRLVFTGPYQAHSFSQSWIVSEDLHSPCATSSSLSNCWGSRVVSPLEKSKK